MVETHECSWCKKNILKKQLFCSNECLLAYNKQNKTKTDGINWTYIEEQRPGTKTKTRIALWVLIVGTGCLNFSRLYLGLSVEAFTIVGLVLVAIVFAYTTRKLNLK